MGEQELKQQVEELKAKLAVLENEFLASQKNLIKETIKEVMKQNKRDSLQTEVMFKFKRNKRQLIKQKILDTCSEKSMTVPELKFTIVDQLNYCSKASFYRYLAEMKDLIDVSGRYVRVLAQREARMD